MAAKKATKATGAKPAAEKAAAKSKTCNVDGCDRPVLTADNVDTRGLCGAHWASRRGDHR